jgi:hypothetical protein
VQHGIPARCALYKIARGELLLSRATVSRNGRVTEYVEARSCWGGNIELKDTVVRIRHFLERRGVQPSDHPVRAGLFRAAVRPH